MNFTRAIVRTPGRSMVDGLTTAGLGPPLYDKAVEQHAAYVEALKSLGLEVTVLDPDEDYPDSTFVEDVALLTPKCAIVTRPGAPSRRGETAAIESALKQFYLTIEKIEPPGTVDAGDIMKVGLHFYIGLSERTNEPGARQIIGILEKHGMTGSTVPLKEVLHLKSGVAYLENNNMVIAGEFVDRPEFSKFNLIEVSEGEGYAANCIWVNGSVLFAAGRPKTQRSIEAAGYDTVVLDVSEFRKLDGGLSCLSLRF
jgi:dimethylargininase